MSPIFVPTVTAGKPGLPRLHPTRDRGSWLAPESIEKPSRADHRRTVSPHSTTKLPIGGDQRDRPVVTRCQCDQGIIATTRRVHHPNCPGSSLGPSLGYSAARLAFEHHYHGAIEVPGPTGNADALHQFSSRPGPVPPPARRARADHVGRVDKQTHDTILNPSPPPAR